MSKQLSDCCKAEINSNNEWEHRHECSKCGRHIGTPIPQQNTQMPSVEEVVEEFDNRFPLPKILTFSGGKGVERDKMINWLRHTLEAHYKASEQKIEEARREERERIRQIVGRYEEMPHSSAHVLYGDTEYNNHAVCYGKNEAVRSILEALTPTKTDNHTK